MPGFTLGFCFYGDILSVVLSLKAPLSAGPFLKISNDLSDVADAATSRSNLGLAIGTNVQAQDAELQAIAGLVSAADQLPYFTGSGTASLTTLTAYARTLLDDANEAAARATLGLTAGGAGDIWVEKAGDIMSGPLTVQDVLTMASELQHEGDVDTKIGFTTDVTTHTVGGLIALRLTNTTQDLVEIGDIAGTGDWDIDFNNAQMFLEGNSGNLAVGTKDTTFVVAGVTTKTRLFLVSPDEASFFGFTLKKETDTAGRATGVGIIRARAGATAVQDGDLLGTMQFMGHDGTDYNRSAAIQVEVDGIVSANTVPGALFIQTAETNVLINRVKIGKTGNVSIGWETDNLRLSITGSGTNSPPLVVGDFLPGSATTEPEVVLGLVNENAGGNYVAMSFQVRTASVPGAVIGLERTADFQGDLFLQIRSAAGASPEIMRWRHTGQVQITAGDLEFNEITAPGGGAANTARVYVEDNGAGKTRLMVIFNTGAAQQIEIQP